jgi:hypothetical protein
MGTRINQVELDQHRPDLDAALPRKDLRAIHTLFP